jgi:predicted RNA polymerase sigma factor
VDLWRSESARRRREETLIDVRFSRAKQTIKTAGLRFELPPEAQRSERLRVVLHVLYLIFNEGYTTSQGQALQRADLTSEAIRLTRMLLQLVADEGEVAGLLALMLLTVLGEPRGRHPMERSCL